jgi:hypothetical protein
MVERSLSMREVLGSIPSFSNHEVLLWYDRRQPHNPKLCTSWVRLWQTSTMSNFLFYIHIGIQHTTYTMGRNITIFNIVKINGASQVITQFCRLFIFCRTRTSRYVWICIISILRQPLTTQTSGFSNCHKLGGFIIIPWVYQKNIHQLPWFGLVWTPFSTGNGTVRWWNHAT